MPPRATQHQRVHQCRAGAIERVRRLLIQVPETRGRIGRPRAALPSAPGTNPPGRPRSGSLIRPSVTRRGVLRRRRAGRPPHRDDAVRSRRQPARPDPAPQSRRTGSQDHLGSHGHSEPRGAARRLAPMASAPAALAQHAATTEEPAQRLPPQDRATMRSRMPRPAGSENARGRSRDRPRSST